MFRIHVYLLLFTVLGALTLQAQPLDFIDDFQDNTNQWILFENPRGSSKLEDGYLLLNNKTDRGLLNLTQHLVLPDRDFKVSCTVEELTGTGNAGLVWGALSNLSFFAFRVYADGSYNVVTSKYGKVTELLPRRPLPDQIKVTGKVVLTVAKSYEGLTFSVNDLILDTIPFRMFSGTEIGVSLEGKGSIKVDRLTVFQEPVEINLATTFEGYEKENLGPNINSTYAENGVIIAHGGDEMYVVRNGHPGNMGQLKKDNIWWSEYLPDTGWTRLKRLGKPLNNTASNFVISVAPDGNRLLVANTYRADGGPAGEGLSTTTRLASGWAVPTKVEIDNFRNDSRFVDFCLSPDQRSLLMAIDNGQTIGGLDLFVSFNEGGSWSEPVNLGADVNTFANDFTPFLGADGKTLYFSSFGHPGYGSADLFVTRRMDDSWSFWSDPENLGPDINTPNWDANLSIPARGDYAYLTSNENSMGDIDIFRIQLHESLRPSPVILVRGKVLNSSTMEGMAAVINYYDLLDGSFLGEARSNATGRYQMVLPAGESYSFLAEKEGYFSVGENVDAIAIDRYTEIERDLLLGPLETGSTIRLNNVFFETGQHDLKPESYHELNRLITLMREQATMTIELSGHTDNVGGESYNQDLSERRAREVYEFLTPYINESRLSFKGYGESKPVATNETDAGRETNRRVEFTILSVGDP